MNDLFSTKSIQTGLFTFYIGQNNIKYYKPDNQRSVQISIQQNSTRTNGRNVKVKYDITRSNILQQNCSDVQERQEKLNKFLVNCIGPSKKIKHNNLQCNQQNARYSNSNIEENSYQKATSHSKYSHNIHQLVQNPKNSYQKSKDGLSKQKNEQSYKKPVQIPRINFHKDKDQCMQYFKPKQKSSQLPYSVVKLDIQQPNPQIHKKSKSQSTQYLFLQRNKQVLKHIKQKQKNKKLTLDKNIKQQKLKQKKRQYAQLCVQNSNYSPVKQSKHRQKQYDKQNNGSSLYNRVLKFSSEQVGGVNQEIIQKQRIILKSLKTQHDDDPSSKNFKNQLILYEKLSRLQKRVLDKQKLKQIFTNRPYYNSHQNSEIKLPTIFKTKISQNQAQTQNGKNQLLTVQKLKKVKSNINLNANTNQNTILKQTNLYRNIPINNFQKYQKRNMRLQLIYGTNSRAKFNLPIDIKMNKIQEEKKVNQLYYSTKNQQFKAPEINLGARHKDRIIDSFAERKKWLIQKLSIGLKQKQKESVEKSKANSALVSKQKSKQKQKNKKPIKDKPKQKRKQQSLKINKN